MTAKFNSTESYYPRHGGHLASLKPRSWVKEFYTHEEFFLEELMEMGIRVKFLPYVSLGDPDAQGDWDRGLYKIPNRHQRAVLSLRRQARKYRAWQKRTGNV